MNKIKISLFLLVFSVLSNVVFAQTDTVKYVDDYRMNVPFAKSPTIIKFKSSYWMYYSIPPGVEGAGARSLWGIGIAKSEDLVLWDKVGEILPVKFYERVRGIASPEAMVRDNEIHLFYQTVGSGHNDGICHAKSFDGIEFERNATNPVVRNMGDWNTGRASEPAFIQYNYRNWMYFTTYAKDEKTQVIGVVSAPYPSHFVKDDWALMVKDTAVLAPFYPWEGCSVEAVSVIEVEKTLYMFYSGAFPNRPQQIGVAKSNDGMHFSVLKNRPFISTGDINDWNYSEVGHPFVFQDDGVTRLFFHGNAEGGEESFITSVEIGFDKDGPYLVE